MRRHEGVCWIEARPDHDTDEAVDEELLKEEVPLVRLVGVGVCAEDTSYATVVVDCTMGLEISGLGGLDLGPIAAHEQETGDESTEDLREDVVRDFLPGEALPDGEADRDGGVEVASGDWCTGDDSEGDADCKCPADLEERAEDGYAEFCTDAVGR